MLPVIHIGPLVLQTPGLVLILGVWSGISAIERFAKKHGQNADRLSTLVLIGLVAGVLGARLAYAGANWHAFTGNWQSIFSLTPTMMDPFGGFAAAVIAALIYGQRVRLSFWPTLDALTPGAAIFVIFIHLASLLSGDGFGTETSLPWGIWLWGELRHPTQLYAAAAAALIAFILYRGQRQFLQTPGVLALTWLACTAFVSILLEPLRGDSTVIAAGLRMEQLVAWFVLAGAMILIGRRLNVRGKSLAVSRVEDTARGSE